MWAGWLRLGFATISGNVPNAELFRSTIFARDRLTLVFTSKSAKFCDHHRRVEPRAADYSFGLVRADHLASFILVLDPLNALRGCHRLPEIWRAATGAVAFAAGERLRLWLSLGVRELLGVDEMDVHGSLPRDIKSSKCPVLGYWASRHLPSVLGEYIFVRSLLSPGARTAVNNDDIFLSSQ